jgi:hypothetical protein
MTYRFLSILTSTFLALHTVLGCCWHHAHASECGNACSVESPDADAGHCGDACGSSGCADHPHQERHACQENACVFINLAGRGSQGPLLAAAMPVVCPSCGELPLHAACGTFFAIDALLPPLRLHLAHRVLLL